MKSNRNNQGRNDFGRRLVTLRRRAGYTQAEFSAEVGMSRRTLPYYEKRNGCPGLHILRRMAQVLNISIDELVGAIPIKRKATAREKHRQRQVELLEQLKPAERREVLEVIESFGPRPLLKRKRK